MRAIEKELHLPELEERILDRWEHEECFKRSIELRKDAEEYVFYDGPPFANNLPHYGHLLAGIIKDIVPRYWTMRGKRVERRFGWDTHGLPVEMEIEKELGIVGKSIEEVGIATFNEACRASVLKYSKEWERTVIRTGRWVDFQDRYLTMQPTFMESVWWAFKQLWDKDLIYEGYRILPYSTGCHTTLSNFEASADYRDVQDPAVTLTMPLVDDPNTRILVWTTTPWTLPANLAVAAHPEIIYVKLKDLSDGVHYIMAKSLISTLFKKTDTYEIVEEMKGASLKGLRYTPLFDFFAHKATEGAFQVLIDDYVTADDGTGLVHLAPAYGEDDHRVCTREGITLVDPINMDGRFTDEVETWKGIYIKDADPLILQDLKKRDRVIKHVTLVHSYPYCERSGFPLMYKAMPVWFVKVTAIKDRIIAANQLTSWIPEHLKSGRFGKWLEGARDWNISRNRYWGTPIPIWRCSAERCDHIEVMGSIDDLQHRSGSQVTDLHMHKIDHLTWKCPKCGGEVTRIAEVLDCWFESGAMPYAQHHYPFENKEKVERGLPADFIAEGLDQTRGWFYTLMVLSTALFDKPAFKNVVVNGLILAEDGKKMSKRLRNYPIPDKILNEYGADALRLYLINSGLVKADDLRFSERGVRDVVRLVLLPLWNAYKFFVTYARIDGFEHEGSEAHLPSGNILDQWILSRVETLSRTVQTEMDNYRLYKVVPALLDFVEDLTNWYIRLNRRRFWQEGLSPDKLQAYATFHHVLTHFAMLLAPFTPFMAEEIFGNLTGAEDRRESVHLKDFPIPEGDKMDEALEHTFALMQEAIVMGRGLREQHKTGVRQPLSRLTIIHNEREELDRFSPLVDVIREELNVKEITFAQNEADFVTVEAKPNLKILGPRLGKKMKEVAPFIKNLSADEIRGVMEGGTLSVAGVELDAECFLIQRIPHEGLVVAAGEHISVALDMHITQDLKMEGLAREAVNRIQRLRKDTGLEVQDRIRIGYETKDQDIETAFRDYSDYISTETLAVEFSNTALTDPLVTKEYSIQDYTLVIHMEKA